MQMRATLLAAGLLVASASGGHVAAQTTTIDNVTIVDVTDGRLRPHKTIVIEGNRIARIDDATEASHAAATLDGSGMFVIPGLWDMHVHAYFTNDTARFHSTSEVMLPLFIANGVTGVRDLGSNLEATLAARDSIAAHQLIGPRMLVSGPMLDGPTTRYAAAIKVATAEEARAAVRMLKERGVDMIKTQSLLSREAYFALADEAARIGIPFEGHVPNAITGMEAIAAHQRSFEHLLGVRDTATSLIAALARQRVWQCPTVINSVGTATDLTSDPGVPFWLEQSVDGWRRTAATRAAESDSAARAAAERATRRLALIKTMYDLKIPFLAGTDAPAGYDLVPGASLHRELQLFVRAGLTPLQALQTATLNPAVYFGKTADWGMIAAGKVADLVVLRANPLVDIANTRSVAAVVADGRYYSPRELDRLRVRIMELAAKSSVRAPAVFHVSLGPVTATPVSGRLLIFAKRLAPDDKRPVARVDMDQIDTHATAIAAQEVPRFAPGATVDLDADVSAFPTPFSRLEPGHYAVQAVLDRDHSYNYTSRGPGDLVSAVVEMDLPGDASQRLTLATIVPESDPLQPLSNVPAATRDVYPAAKTDIHPIDFVSPALSNFWGRPVTMHGWVVTPPDYAAHRGQRYPTVYYTQGFGGSLRSLHDVGVARWNEMKMGKAPSMIWVGIDQSSPSGTSEFVNSVNNGPWGRALTAELIPDLERHYRMDAKPSGRFVTGHSSGGWAALWLQVSYPKVFGGAWPTSPDPSDFHNFLGIDLYAQGANVYRKPDGTPWPLAQDKGEMLVSIEDYTRREVVLGTYGGQLASFEWVFSPRGADGLPVAMFDRTTGAVDTAVIAYWRDHYDVAERLRRHWPELKRDLDGKIHLTVGSADTFYLDGAARLLEATMKELGAKTDFRYVEGRGHFDLYAVGDDPWGLYQAIAREMYTLARPGSKR